MMPNSVAIVGAGVSGLTCGVLLAEQGTAPVIFAEEIGQKTTSAAAAAIWFPYDASPADKVVSWALETHGVLADLARDPRTGVSMIELRQFSRTGRIEIPKWARSLGASPIPSTHPFVSDERAGPGETASRFAGGYVLTVPLTDTTIYLDYLVRRFTNAGGQITPNVRLKKLEEVDPRFDPIVNCAGIGAATLVPDPDLEPHRGQVVLVPKLVNLTSAIVCDDAPPTYLIPRTNDCVFGGTNEISDNADPDPAATSRILAECSRVLNITTPKVLAERVGLRPFRRSGVRLERSLLRDGRAVIHNYGHGGAGFTVSWGCAREVVELAE
jgi:D-amino-acid oxidase